MDGFSDIESSSSDVGSEVNEVETPDADFGDGDGVNDFDDTVKSMSKGEDFIDYSSSDLESEEENVSSNLTTDENVDDVLASLSEEEEIKFVPKSDGVWEGEKGDSKWIPDDDKVPGKANPDGKNWGEIKKEFEIDGINFEKGEPDFSETARGEAHIKDFSDSRDSNFKQADENEALKRGCSPEEVKEWRKENGYTWHERKDCETMDKVPSIVHNNVFHSGGISEKKKEISMEDWL